MAACALDVSAFEKRESLINERHADVVERERVALHAQPLDLLEHPSSGIGITGACSLEVAAPVVVERSMERQCFGTVGSLRLTKRGRRDDKAHDRACSNQRPREISQRANQDPSLSYE